MQRKIEKKLLEWKNKDSNRMPLIINGARQVGKTYIVREFGDKYFKNVVYVNLEYNKLVASYFNENISPERIIQFLEINVNEAIIPGETLIFFDEIQSCERALTSLKYFCEEAPEYHVIAAGSLLGVAINRENFSFPVGKVESLTLYPFDFEEYLWARNETMLSEEIRRCYNNMEAMTNLLHEKALDLYKEYLIIGGMPACINEFLKRKKLIDVSIIQERILNDYISDMAKYADKTTSVKIRACYNSIPTQLGKENKKFQYKVVQKGGTATIFGESIEWLKFAGIVLKCQKLEQAVEPISVYTDLSSFKLYMGDIGLLTYKSGISLQTILQDQENIFLGSLVENYIAQQLTCNGFNLYYWTSEHIAELDFIVQKENKIIGIEVKKGIHTKSKSLNVFISKYNPTYSIRFSTKNFGEKDNIKSIPLYAAYCFEG